MEQVEMTKQELYKAAVDVYKETGQGLPGHILRPHGLGALLDELISEGKLKVIDGDNMFIHNEEWICLTKGYCLEESDEGIDNLNFIRAFLNIETLVDDNGDDFPLEEALKDKDFMEAYNIWLVENKKELDEISTIEPEYK
jgi:hypothetical protein